MHGSLPFDTAIPWAIRPEILTLLARANQGTLSADELQAALPRSATQDTTSQGGIAVIPLRGVITPRPSLISMLFGGGGGLEQFRSDLRNALQSQEVGSILVNIDSPGGSTELVTETANELRQAKRQKPVVAIANSMAASAAYWIGSQATEFVATPSALVGSIGVYSVHADYTKMNETMGVKPTLISAGKHKVDTHPDQPLTDAGREEIQAIVDGAYQQFTADVAKGRGTPVADVRSGYGEGRVLTAKDAKDQGLVDRVATFEETLRQMATGSVGNTTSSSSEDDNPQPNAQAAEEAAARIAELVIAQPRVL